MMHLNAVGRALVVALACLLAGLQQPAFADEITLSDSEKARYERLVQELRCLVCQNQSVAESNAPLAVDLRGIVRRQIADGLSDREIKQYMRERYGDFVLYQPPFNASTALLWISPAILLLIALLILRQRLRSGVPEDDLPYEEDRLSGPDNDGDGRA